jgi:cytochrome c553
MQSRSIGSQGTIKMKRGITVVSVCVFALVAGTGIPGCSPEGTPKPDKRKTESTVDLRAAQANVSDIAEGARAAESCVRCHGMKGISATRGVPNLAGQRPAYLYAKLRAYQAGTRGDHGMEGALKFLSDDALVKVAAHYASLEPAQPLEEGAAREAPGGTDPVAAGKSAAAPCAACHGERGISKTPGMPNLAGFEPKVFLAAMSAYKSGQRRHDLMKSLAAALSEADLKNLALYYGLQKPERAQTPAPGDPAAGKTAAVACAGCHGEGGVSANPANPSLAGQDAQYFGAAMRAYKDGSRKDDAMKAVAAALDDSAIGNLAAYYAAQQPQPPKVDKPLTTAEWVQRCDRCHGVNGNSTDPRVPALAAQRAEYLEKSLDAYRSGLRSESPMAAMSGSLTAADIKGLAAHYARQRARAFVYLVLPPN